jgi:cyclopropane fatty-acyl-phospholipid synthase-like methyltransferase
MTTTGPLHHPRYPRSDGYDLDWVVANQMGPNALWLTESLCEVMPIEPGAKVLDLGCGTAMSSILLAREFGARCGRPISGSRRRTTRGASSRPASPIW